MHAMQSQDEVDRQQLGAHAQASHHLFEARIKGSESHVQLTQAPEKRRAKKTHVLQLSLFLASLFFSIFLLGEEDGATWKLAK